MTHPKKNISVAMLQYTFGSVVNDDRDESNSDARLPGGDQAGNTNIANMKLHCRLQAQTIPNATPPTG